MRVDCGTRCPRCLLRRQPRRTAASRCSQPLRTHLQMLRHRAARRGLAAVLAARLKGSDRPLCHPVPVGWRQWLAALRAAAGLMKAVPAVDAVAVALVALVHLALGQRQANAALHRALVIDFAKKTRQKFAGGIITFPFYPGTGPVFNVRSFHPSPKIREGREKAQTRTRLLTTAAAGAPSRPAPAARCPNP